MSVVISDEILTTTRMNEEEMKREIAIMLFQKEKLTLAQASRFAGMNRIAFQHLLASHQIPVHYGVEDFEQDIKITTSSGNIFADLGLPNPDEMLAKAELARKISQAITARGLTQVEAAELLGIDQPKISALIRGKLTGFSLERMFKFLNDFDSDIEIIVKPKSSHNARIIVK